MKPVAAISTINACRVTAGEGAADFADSLAIEEPLEIRVGYSADGKRIHKPVSITMRTPGSDAELAVGFLFTEGIISSVDQVKEVKHCGLKLGRNQTVIDRAGALNSNTIRVDLVDGIDLDLKRLERNFYTTSSCGVCGKASIDALATGVKKLDGSDLKISPQTIVAYA